MDEFNYTFRQIDGIYNKGKDPVMNPVTVGTFYVSPSSSISLSAPEICFVTTA